MSFITPQIIPTNTGIIIGGVIIFSVLIYGFRSGSHVRCPECLTMCERYSDEYEKGRKVLCPKCQIIWDLGVTYNSYNE